MHMSLPVHMSHWESAQFPYFFARTAKWLHKEKGTDLSFCPLLGHIKVSACCNQYR